LINSPLPGKLLLFAFLRLLPYFCETIAGPMRFSSYMIRFYKFADMLPANFYIPD
jgi:hypothetical protein